MENIFTANIKTILQKHFGKSADDVFEKSQLIQYINEKTRSANKGSKARSSFANLYAIYVIIEDYIAKGYDKKVLTRNMKVHYSTNFLQDKENYLLEVNYKIML